MLNYMNDGNKKQGILKNAFFENNYLSWMSKTRLHLKVDPIRHDTLSDNSPGYLYQIYKIKAQIFLDINETETNTEHFSITVFDTYATFYNLH